MGFIELANGQSAGSLQVAHAPRVMKHHQELNMYTRLSRNPESQCKFQCQRQVLLVSIHFPNVRITSSNYRPAYSYCVLCTMYIVSVPCSEVAAVTVGTPTPVQGPPLRPRILHQLTQKHLSLKTMANTICTLYLQPPEASDVVFRYSVQVQ